MHVLQTNALLFLCASVLVLSFGEQVPIVLSATSKVYCPKLAKAFFVGHFGVTSSCRVNEFGCIGNFWRSFKVLDE